MKINLSETKGVMKPRITDPLIAVLVLGYLYK
jgi:hypothetical protein